MPIRRSLFVFAALLHSPLFALSAVPAAAASHVAFSYAIPAEVHAFSATSVGPGAPETAPATPVPRAAAAGQAGFGPLDPAPPTGISVEDIIKKFGDRESAFNKALNEYTFTRTVKVDTINDDNGRPDGEYQEVTDIVLSDGGGRAEHVTFAPANTIQKVIMTENDFADIEHRLPFVLTAPDLPQYDLTYLGRQKVDDIDTYVFDCKPKVLEKGKRYFQGKVWVDQQQFQIVLINGKSVPDSLRRGHEDLSPPYTTYYQEFDGVNWFPVYTKADGVLHFPGGQGYLSQDVHLRYVVKYENYKRFRAKSRIIYNGQDLPPAENNAPGNKPGAGAPAPATPPADNPNALPPPDPDAPPLTRPAKPN